MSKPPVVEDPRNKMLVAARAFKQTVERATRIIWSNPVGAEKLLNEALRRAEEAGL